jgi:GAF domain-containing protein
MADIDVPAASEGPRVPRVFWLEVAAVVGGYVAAALAGPAATRWRLALLVVGGACVAVPVYLKSRRELAARRARWSAERLAIEYEARLAAMLGDVVTPIASLLGSLGDAEPAERAIVAAQLTQAVVDAAARLCGAERTRSVYYTPSGDALVPAAWTGRADRPTRVLRRGRDVGDVAHGLVERRDSLLVGDAGPWSGTTGEYGAFLGVAVFADGRAFGLLTVDSPHVGGLDETDLMVTRALAHLLGAGLAVARTPGAVHGVP